MLILIEEATATICFIIIVLGNFIDDAKLAIYLVINSRFTTIIIITITVIIVSVITIEAVTVIIIIILFVATVAISALNQ